MPSFSEDKKNDELEKVISEAMMINSIEAFFEGNIYAACNAYGAGWISNSKKVKLIDAARKKLYVEHPEPKAAEKKSMDLYTTYLKKCFPELR